MSLRLYTHSSLFIAIPYTIGEDDVDTESVFVTRKKQTTGGYFITQIVYSLIPVHSNTIKLSTGGDVDA